MDVIISFKKGKRRERVKDTRVTVISRSTFHSLIERKDWSIFGWSNAIGNLFSTRLIFYSIIAIDSSLHSLKDWNPKRIESKLKSKKANIPTIWEYGREKRTNRGWSWCLRASIVRLINRRPRVINRRSTREGKGEKRAEEEEFRFSLQIRDPWTGRLEL